MDTIKILLATYSLLAAIVAAVAIHWIFAPLAIVLFVWWVKIVPMNNDTDKEG